MFARAVRSGIAPLRKNYAWYENQADQSNCQGGLHTHAGQIPRAELPGNAASDVFDPRGRPGRERGSRAAGGTHWGHILASAKTHGARTWLQFGALPAPCGFHWHLETFTELFSPVNTLTSERASADVVSLLRCLWLDRRSIQLSRRGILLAGSVETRPILTAQWSGLRLTFWLELWVWQRKASLCVLLAGKSFPRSQFQ